MKKQYFAFLKRPRALSYLKILFLNYVILGFIPAYSYSQSMFVKRTNGTIVEHQISTINKMTYLDNKLVIKQINNVVESYDLSQINQINFKGFVAGLNDEVIENNPFVVFPNPTSGPVEIDYQVNGVSPVKLEVLDMSGKFVTIVVDEVLNPGNYKTKWDLSDRKGKQVVSGSYMVRFSQESNSTTKMIVIQK
jgi:hypothetical protein